MVTAVSSSTPRPPSRSNPSSTPTRRPPPPSDAENLVLHRRPKSREVTSRYLSPAPNASSNSKTSTNSTPARRLPSPVRPRTPLPAAATPMPTIKRSQSMEQRRPSTPTPNTNSGGEAVKMLLKSTRSLSVSFQGESFSLKVSKAKPAPTPAPVMMRRGTPERRKMTPVGGDGGKTIEQQRWPARLRPDNFMSRSLDLMDERKKLGGPNAGGIGVVRDLQKSMVGMSNRNLVGKRFQDSGSVGSESNLASGSGVLSDSVSSDSVSSGSTSGGLGRQNLIVPPKLRQESNTSKLKHGRPSELLSPLAKCSTTKVVPLVNYFIPKRLSTDNSLASPKSMTSSRSFSSPQRGASRPASPSKLSASLISSRSLPSPQWGASRPASPSKLSTSLISCRSLSSPQRGASRPASPIRLSTSMISSGSLSSHQRGASRPASPSKLSTSYTTTPSRGMPSPARVRSGATSTPNSGASSASSFLSFAVNARRGRTGENKIDDAHFLRLLHNRLLQWCFVNARANDASAVQILIAEKSLCEALESTSQLRDSVRDKKLLLRALRQDLKLLSILKGQMKHLDEWTTIDMDHLNSLLGVTAALKATTLRLPVIGGARADVQNVKESISSAVDVIQAMVSSVCPLSLKVDKINSLVAELSNMVSKEKGHLEECRRLLSGLAVMQVTDCTLGTHIIQLSGVPSTSNRTTLL